jgi:hypothetical protein
MEAGDALTGSALTGFAQGVFGRAEIAMEGLTFFSGTCNICADYHKMASWSLIEEKKPDHSDLSDPTSKEHPTGQRYLNKILCCSAPWAGMEKRAMMHHTPRRST